MYDVTGRHDVTTGSGSREWIVFGPGGHLQSNDIRWRRQIRAAPWWVTRRSVAVAGREASPCSGVFRTTRAAAGYSSLFTPNRPAYVAMNWQRDNGRRRPGRPTKTWRTTFNEDLHDMRLTWMGAKRSASDRPKWRKLVARCSSRNWRN